MSDNDKSLVSKLFPALMLFCLLTGVWSFAIIQDVFGNEDFRASELCHRGLASGAVPDVIYCGMEAPIPQFYEGIESVMAKAAE